MLEAAFSLSLPAEKPIFLISLAYGTHHLVARFIKNAAKLLLCQLALADDDGLALFNQSLCKSPFSCTHFPIPCGITNGSARKRAYYRKNRRNEKCHVNPMRYSR